MSIYGQWVAATIDSGETSTAAIDLGRPYDFLSVEVPTMDTCSLSLKVAEKVGGTYYPLGLDSETNEETFNRADVWRLGGWQFIKIVASAPQSAERLIRVCGMRY